MGDLLVSDLEPRGRLDLKRLMLGGVLLLARVSGLDSAILDRILLSELLRRSSLGVSGSPLALSLRNSCLVALARMCTSEALLSSLSFTAKAFLRTLPVFSITFPAGYRGDTELESPRGEHERAGLSCKLFGVVGVVVVVAPPRRHLGLESRCSLCGTSEDDFVMRAAPLRSFLDCLTFALCVESPLISCSFTTALRYAPTLLLIALQIMDPVRPESEPKAVDESGEIMPKYLNPLTDQGLTIVQCTGLQTF